MSSAVIENRLAAIEAKIHVLKKLAAEMREHEAALNIQVFQAAKHGIEVIVNPEFSILVDEMTHVGGVRFKTYNGSHHWWGVYINTNGKSTVHQCNTMPDVLKYIREECLTVLAEQE